MEPPESVHVENTFSALVVLVWSFFVVFLSDRVFAVWFNFDT